MKKKKMSFKEILKNYRQTILLVLGLIIGAICGLIFKEKTAIVKPLGDLFLNLMFVIIVPLVFLTISTSIAKMESPKRLKKIFGKIILVSIITSLVAVFVSLGITSSIKLVKTDDVKEIKESLSKNAKKPDKVNLLESTVNLVSVDDFTGLLSKENVIAIAVFAIIFGFAMQKVGEKAKPLLNIMETLDEVILKIVDIIMYYAPIGLGCYFASLIGTFGSEIAKGYLRLFIVYTVLAIIFYFVVYTIYAFIAGGKKAVKAFWKNAFAPTFTSLATCSSAACIPVNIDSAKKMGIPNDVSETFISLGTSMHQDGSVIGSVFKIMFLVYIFGTDISSPAMIGQIIITALLATLLISAVPIGGGTVSESLIISMLGYPMVALPLLTMVATVIDPPATLLNVVGDESAAMLVAKGVDGKNWQKENLIDKIKEKMSK